MKNPGIRGGPLVLPSTVRYKQRLCGEAAHSETDWNAVKSGTPVETWSGSDTPNFYSKTRKGELLAHNYYRYTREEIAGLSSVQDVSWNFCAAPNVQWARWSGDWCTLYGAPWKPPSSPVVETFKPDTLSQKAASTFLSKAQFDVGTFLAESRQLRTLFQGIVRSFANLALKGAFRAHSLEDYLDIWLSFRYGLRPLLSDIENFNKAAAALSTKSKKIFVKAKATEASQITGYSTPHVFGDSNQYWRLRWQFSGYVRYSFNIVGELNPTRVRLDPASTLWEVVPYSFVIDWFYTVGAWIDAVRLVESGLNFTSSLNSITSFTAVPVQDQIQLYNTMVGQVPTFRGTYSWIEKLRMPHGIDVKAPSSTGLVPANPLHTVDAIALILKPWVQYTKRRWSFIPFHHPYSYESTKIR